MGEQRPRGEFGGARHDETGTAKTVIKLEDQLNVLGEELTGERNQRKIEQDKHIGREKDLRKEINILRRQLISAEETIERLQELVSEQREDLKALREYRSTIDDLRQRLEEREEEDRDLAAEHRQRSKVARWLASAWPRPRNRPRM
jgi:chromosome segregation ATPase